MKTRVFNYVVCAVALFVAIALILGTSVSASVLPVNSQA